MIAACLFVSPSAIDESFNYKECENGANLPWRVIRNCSMVSVANGDGTLYFSRLSYPVIVALMVSPQAVREPSFISHLNR